MKEKIKGLLRKAVPHAGLICTVCACICFFAAGGLMAASNYVEVENTYETGLINIDLTQYDNDGNEIDGTTSETIIPGDRIIRHEVIKNEGEDCWIRIMTREDDDVFENIGFADDNMEVTTTGDGYSYIDGGFETAADGAHYYTRILKKGESVDCTMFMDVSDDLDESRSGETITQDIRVEAIQVENYTPDFTSSYPWSDVTIIDAIYDTNYYIPDSNPMDIDIAFLGGAEGIVSSAGDYSTWSQSYMPGDSSTGKLVLENNGTETIKLYLEYTLGEYTPLYEALEIHGSVKQDGTTTQIFDGKLSDKAAQNFLLAELSPGETADVYLTVELPYYYDNTYSLMSGSSVFAFSTTYITENDMHEAEETAESTTHVDGGKTGDDTNIALDIALFLGGAFVAGAIIAYLKRKEKAEKEAEMEIEESEAGENAEKDNPYAD